jgi:xylitol oxidase
VLNDAGFALPNMASLPHITVTGACATGTHGSGSGNRVLADSVSAIELAAPDGGLLRFSRADSGDRFFGVVVGLGACGIVTSLTLDLIPAFSVSQEVYEYLELGAVCGSFEAIVESAYSVSLFTDWQNNLIDQVWVKGGKGEAVIPARRQKAKLPLHPIRGVSAESCTEQLGIPGPWHQRLPHFRMEHTPSFGEELQSEYFVPIEAASDAMQAVMSLKGPLASCLLVSEIRTIAGDGFWMSPCYERSSAAIHFTWKPRWESVKSLLPGIEAALSPFDYRPHWGKLFTMDPETLRSRYRRRTEFLGLLEEIDPDRKFGNVFLEDYIYE